MYAAAFGSSDEASGEVGLGISAVCVCVCRGVSGVVVGGGRDHPVHMVALSGCCLSQDTRCT